jgi:hypothetical protein
VHESFEKLLYRIGPGFAGNREVLKMALGCHEPEAEGRHPFWVKRLFAELTHENNDMRFQNGTALERFDSASTDAGDSECLFTQRAKPLMLHTTHDVQISRLWGHALEFYRPQVHQHLRGEMPCSINNTHGAPSGGFLLRNVLGEGGSR